MSKKLMQTIPLSHEELADMHSLTSEHFTGNDLDSDSEAVFPARPKLLMLPLDKISPWPLNPRKHFDPEALEELAASIRTHGVQQPVVVRQHVENLGTAGGQVSYSIVMGERRWRASRLAGVGTIPALVRTNLDDKQHAMLALEENTKRVDLTAIEEARGYKECMAQGYTQSQIGGAAGVGQSRIANIIRLLELPEDVQALIENGKLKTGHGIALARYKDFPLLCSAAAAATLKNEWSVRSLESGVLNDMASEYRFMLAEKEDGLFARLDGYPKPKFDSEAICKACPLAAYRVENNRPYCLRPDHYVQLSREATADADAAANAEAERLRAVAAERQAEAKTHLAEATTPAEKKAADTELQQAKAAALAVKDGLPKTEYSKIEKIGASDPHACRFGQCPCHIKAVDNYNDQIVDACADVSRQSKIKAAETKTANVGRKERFAETRRQIDAAPLPAMLTSLTNRLAAVACWHSLRNAKKEAKMQIIERLAHDGPEIAALRELLTRKGYDVPDAEAWPVLEAVGLAAMAGITGEVLMRDELLQRYEYGDSDTAKATRTAWVLSNTPQATPSVAPQVTHQAEYESRLFPCADCKAEDGGAFWVDLEGQDTFKSNTKGAWVCALCQDKRKDAAADGLVCGRCEGPLTPGAFDAGDLVIAGNPLRMSTGELRLPDGRVFCDQCGPTTWDNGQPMQTPPAPNTGGEDDEASDYEPQIMDASKMDAGFCRTCSIRPVVAGEKDCAYCIALFYRAGTGKEARIGDLCNL